MSLRSVKEKIWIGNLITTGSCSHNSTASTIICAFVLCKNIFPYSFIHVVELCWSMFLTGFHTRDHSFFESIYLTPHSSIRGWCGDLILTFIQR